MKVLLSKLIPWIKSPDRYWNQRRYNKIPWENVERELALDRRIASVYSKLRHASSEDEEKLLLRELVNAYADRLEIEMERRK